VKAGKTAIMILVIGLSVGMMALAIVSVVRSQRTAELHERAVRQLRGGNYGDAAELFEQALAIRPDEPAYLANYGLCLEMMGDHAGSIDAYQRSLELWEDPQVRFQLGRVNCTAGEVETGVQIMWQVNSAVMLTARQMGDLGICLEASGRPGEAIPYLERGLTASPDNPALKQALDRASAYMVVTD